MDAFDEIAAHIPFSEEDEPAQHADPGDHGALQTWRNVRDDEVFPPSNHRTWDQELPRWLATLNPGRTGHEYGKALRYFFETHGVPQHLTELSFDLLLAYRGALALRASSRDRPQAPRRPGGVSAIFDAQLSAPWNTESPAHLATPTVGDGSYRRTRPPSNGLLAPATVNIRLTALRQFLVHCASLELLPSLTPDRIRSALRRLSIERRRPYQILAEREWDAFLQAALAPAGDSSEPPSAPKAVGPEIVASGTKRGPWGISRAERAAHRGHLADQNSRGPAENTGETSEKPEARTPFSRSRAGLTGVRTAQRDHALISLALATGLRAIELVSLDVGDLVRDWHEGREEWWLVLPDAKTKGQHGGRTLPLAPSLVETLVAYIQATGRRWESASDRKSPLFLSLHSIRERNAMAGGVSASVEQRTGRRDVALRRLSTTQVREIVDRVEAQWLSMQGKQPRDAGVAGESRSISPHALRHSTALALLEGDGTARPPASVEHVRGWLGHFDIRTTQGYLAHLDARRNRKPFMIDPSTPHRAPPEGETSATTSRDNE
jgi:integrase